MSVMQARKIVITSFKYHPGGGYSWEFLVGMFHPVLQILTLYQTKKCHFSHLFSDLAFKKLLYHYLDWNSKKIGIYIFLCLSYIIWN